MKRIEKQRNVNPKEKESIFIFHQNFPSGFNTQNGTVTLRREEPMHIISLTVSTFVSLNKKKKRYRFIYSSYIYIYIDFKNLHY